jgi:hypothetical protein
MMPGGAQLRQRASLRVFERAGAVEFFFEGLDASPIRRALRLRRAGPLNGRKGLGATPLARSECPAASRIGEESLNAMVVDGKLFLSTCQVAASSLSFEA